MADYTFPLGCRLVPLSLWLKTNDYPTTGRTPTVAVRNPEQSGYYLDFSDNVFKNLGWTTQYQNLSSAIDGLYNYTWDTNAVFSSNTTVEAVYYNTGGSTTTAQVATDTIRFYTYDIHVNGGGGGNMTIKGVWTKPEKDKLFSRLDDIQDSIDRIIRDSSEEMKGELKGVLASFGSLKSELVERDLLEKEVLDELGKLNEQI